MEGERILELRSVSIEAKNRAILDRIDLVLARGTRAMIMGGAGSGKSSLLKAAAGILIPDEGEVCYLGRSLSSFSRREDKDFHSHCGFVFQDAALWSNQSLYENIAFPLRFHRATSSSAVIDAAVKKAAEVAGYNRSLSLRPAEVSSGERRLIGLARALVLDPEILFLDEPTASLDEAETSRVIDILVELGNRGRTILIASSSSELAFRAALEIGVISQGRIATWGSYDSAVGWDDPALVGAVGRLRPRPKSTGLLGAWASAITGEGLGAGIKDVNSPSSEDR